VVNGEDVAAEALGESPSLDCRHLRTTLSAGWEGHGDVGQTLITPGGSPGPSEIPLPTSGRPVHL
jgi:hypothetical protein